MITLRNIRVWDTDEIIDLVVPSDGPARDIDADGMTLAPGLADPHVHFRDPGQTHKETMVSGCAAAASGGYTHVLIMPNTVPAMDGEPLQAPLPEAGGAECRDVIDYLQRYEAIHGVTLPVNYDLCVAASKDRAGGEASDPACWEDRLRGGEFGGDHPVTAISDDGSAVPAAILDQVLANAKSTGLYLIEHCEHHDTGAVNDGPVSRQLGVPGIPEDTELAIVARDIEAARRTGAHIHFQHVSTAISFEAIRAAKAEGLPITCETAPHYLALSDEALLEVGTLAKMNPPLRSEADRQATIEAIADGTVDLLATDHAPHTMDEKELGFLAAPNGIIGLECAYGVCHRTLVDGGHISETRLIELMSVEPMRLMGHEPSDVTALLDATSDAAREPGCKRVLDLGALESAGVEKSAANLAVLDTAREWTVDPDRFHSKARNTPFAGWKVTGLPMATILNGRLAFDRF